MHYSFISINSQFIHSNLALRSFEELAKAKGITTSHLESSVNEPIKDLFSMIGLASHYFFSVYLWNRDYTLKLIRDLTLTYPDSKIIVGGPEVSFKPEEFLDRGADLIVIGEGEALFMSEESLDDWIKKGPIIKIQSNEKHLTGPYPHCNDDNRILYYESTRGCPMRCAYCVSESDNHLRFRPMELIKEDLKIFIEKKIPLVKFIDRTFNVSDEHALEILKYHASFKDNETILHMEIEPHFLTDNFLDFLEEADKSLLQVEIGYQASSKEVLQSVNRPYYRDVDKLRLERLMKMKELHQHIDMIVGLPGMDLKEVENTFNDLFNYEPDDLQMGFLKVLPQTSLYHHKDLVARDYPPYEIIKTKWISAEEMKELTFIERALQLFNFETLPFSLKIMVKDEENPFKFYERLAQGLHNLHPMGLERRFKLLNELTSRIYEEELDLDYLRLKKKFLFNKERALLLKDLPEESFEKLPRDLKRYGLYKSHYKSETEKSDQDFLVLVSHQTHELIFTGVKL